MVSTPVLATKLFAPARRPQLVARPRLAERLDTTLDAGHRLTLVSAPAGFGKTTVLGDWLAHLDQRQSQHAGRVALPRRRRQRPDPLLTHLVAALQSADLDVDAAVLESLPTASTAAALTALVNDVARAGEQRAGEAVDRGARRLPRHRSVRGARGGDLPARPPSGSAAPGDGDPLRSAAAAGPAAQSRAAHRGARRRPPLHPSRGAGVPQPGDGAGAHRRRRGRAGGPHRGLDRRPAARRALPARHRRA